MNKKFLYMINYQTFEENLCLMEMKYLFKEIIMNKYFISDKDISPSRSGFIKWRIEVLYTGESIEEIIEEISINKLSMEDFKVHYIKSEQEGLEYKERLNTLMKIGYVINGVPDIHNPKVNLAITKVDGTWIFGIYEKNDCKWIKHDEKPHSYSNALSVKMARSIINIATAESQDLTIIDPCCGVGTVVIEGLDLGVNIVGYEISKPMACNARNNIEYFGYNRDIIKCGDMHYIEDLYDVAIVDIPYGLFSPVTAEEQLKIIQTTRKIAKKIILISFEDMEKELTSCNFKVSDKTSFAKNRFTRHITIAK